MIEDKYDFLYLVGGFLKTAGSLDLCPGYTFGMKEMIELTWIDYITRESLSRQSFG